MRMRLLRPDEFYVSVLDIEPARLAARGVRLVLLDIDNTLLPRTADVVPQPVCTWVDELRECGMQVMLLSNSEKPRTRACAKQLGCRLIANAMKPFTRGYKAALAECGVCPRQAVMVGDQTYTDTLGAHLAGITALLVCPQVKADLRHTLMMRKVEALWMRGYVPQGSTDLRMFE